MGKSTFLRLLLMQERPTRARSSSTATTSRCCRAGDSGISPRHRVRLSDFKLIPGRTVLENVSFVPEVLGVPAANQRRRAFQVLKWVGLQHRMNAMPRTTSGGEQQRIAIARALVNDPVLLIADEPTGNLDPDLSLEIMNLLREINAGGTTVLVATHDRELIRTVRPRDHARSGARRRGRMRALDAFRQGAASLWRSRGSSAFAVVAITLALVDPGRPAVAHVECAQQLSVDIGVRFSVYLADNATSEQRGSIESAIDQSEDPRLGDASQGPGTDDSAGVQRAGQPG